MKKIEERLARLEELAERIKENDLPLEDAVAVFEEGIKLAKGLERDLARIEGKVELLMNQPESEEEKPELGLFDDDSGA
ncbi:MAG TPA: exodeoxyribonuclease VII small subunit [Rectinemataceae bacterium]|nr:exodeoxyribonuclease VII small subunit [Rectinemataceae bacterium]